MTALLQSLYIFFTSRKNDDLLYCTLSSMVAIVIFNASLLMHAEGQHSPLEVAILLVLCPDMLRWLRIVENFLFRQHKSVTPTTSGSPSFLTSILIGKVVTWTLATIRNVEPAVDTQEKV